MVMCSHSITRHSGNVSPYMAPEQKRNAYEGGTHPAQEHFSFDERGGYRTPEFVLPSTVISE